jgi:hypothetical protein
MWPAPATVPSLVRVVSLTTRTRSRSTTGSSGPVTTMAPSRPPKTWSVTVPWWCGWYQNVPDGWSSGMRYL